MRDFEKLQDNFDLLLARYEWMESVLENLQGQPLFGDNDEAMDLVNPDTAANEIAEIVRAAEPAPIFTAQERVVVIDAMQNFRQQLTGDCKHSAAFMDFVTNLISKIAKLEVI